MVRTRFAPSPTGSLHVGNARIAVLNWLFARQNDGVLILRIEDTDEDRNEPGAEERIEEDLRWLGIDWDEGTGAGDDDWPGPNAPYRQSERLHIYREYAQWLCAAGYAYPCYCSAEELAAHREAALERGDQPHYPRTCLGLSKEEIARREAEGRRPVIRYRVPPGPPISVQDVVRGTVTVDRSEIGDFVLLRSDGRPTYNFAVVIDDVLMEITHVIRGVGHLSNAPRQVLLFDALHHAPPVFAHVPTVLGEDRQKLSKRHGARSLAELRAEGYHPDAVVNYLSLLSWSSPSGDEFLTRDRLIEEISLDRIRAVDTVFDPVKLAWLSAKHIERMPLDALTEAVRPYVDFERVGIAPENLASIVAAVRTHLSIFSDITVQLEAFRAAAGRAPQQARAEARLDGAEQQVLERARETLAETQDWEEGPIEEAIKRAGKRAGARGRALYEPLRRVLTGEDHGPPLAALLRVAGKDQVLRLLEGALRRPADD
ncbi:MAG: glutamate--tRNA ligase [Longimicrobiales bacterium]